MSDFTERLRDYGLTLEENVVICDRRVVDAAADLIDSLESIVSDFQQYGCPICNGDCGSANPPIYNCPMSNAHGALAKLRSL